MHFETPQESLRHPKLNGIVSLCHGCISLGWGGSLSKKIETANPAQLS